MLFEDSAAKFSQDRSEDRFLEIQRAMVANIGQRQRYLLLFEDVAAKFLNLSTTAVKSITHSWRIVKCLTLTQFCFFFHQKLLCAAHSIIKLQGTRIYLNQKKLKI